MPGESRVFYCRKNRKYREKLTEKMTHLERKNREK